MSRATPRRRRGLLLLDCVFGLAIVTTVAVLLMVTLHRQRAASLQLAAHRDLLALAEETLDDLRLRQKPPVPPAGTVVELTSLPTAAPAKGTWVRLKVRNGPWSETLVALIPEQPLPATVPPREPPHD